MRLLGRSGLEHGSTVEFLALSVQLTKATVSIFETTRFTKHWDDRYVQSTSHKKRRIHIIKLCNLYL